MEVIGRDREVAEVAERLGGRRLVTVTGPAGIGKTTVARAAATGWAAGRVRTVDLTRVEPGGPVVAAFAGQLGSATYDALRAAAGEGPELLLVDSCEHVTDAAADVVGDLLDAWPDLRVLATSRSPLGLPGESLVVLGPLAVPASPDDLDAAAARLFLERALDAGAAVDGAEEAAAVATLCRHLDGLPLALELAAARTRTMRPGEILDRLTEGVEVLSRPRFRGSPRHRSLSATIDWSYRLLPPGAAALFERLGLFAGPFPEDLAIAVGGDVGLDPAAAADALDLLVASSLVVAEPGPTTTTSFRLLQTVRASARQRLRDSGTLEQAQDRLVDHVVDAAVRVLSVGGRRWDSTVLATLLALYDELAAALRWCLAHDRDERRPMLLAAVLWGVVHQAHSEEVAALCEAVLDRWPDSTDPFAVDAAATLATARNVLGDPEGAVALATATLPRAEQYPTAPVTLRRALGYATRALGDRSAARRHLSEAAHLARERGLLALALEADVTRAQLIAADGDLDRALDVARSARDEAAAAGSTLNELWARTVVAHLGLRRDPASGQADVLAALDDARRLDYPAGVSANLRSLAWGRTRQGDLGGAASALGDLFDDLVARDGVADLRGALFTTAEVLHSAGRPAWGPLLATADALPEVGMMGSRIDDAVPMPDPTGEPLSRRDAVALARRELRAVAAGGATTPAEATPHEATTTHVVPPATPTEVARCVDRGAFWELAYEGRVVHAKASKGLTDICRLLADPGREVHCLDLMGSTLDEAPAGAAVDPTARRAYEERIRDLQEDLEEAEAANDVGRTERAQVELDALIDHLAREVGLGGRPRRPGGSVERARSAVTQRIRAAVRRIEADHPVLARHLAASISTGTWCCYRPEQPTRWET